MDLFGGNMERCWYHIDVNTIPQLHHEEHLGPCGAFFDPAFDLNMIPTAPCPQPFDPNVSTRAGSEQRSECSTPSSPISVKVQPSECSTPSSPSSFKVLPCSEERRRAQNRDSQRTYRQRRACYVRTLEQELEEIHAKNEKLRKCVECLMEAFCEVQKEDWAADCFGSCSERFSSEDEKKRIRN